MWPLPAAVCLPGKISPVPSAGLLCLFSRESFLVQSCFPVCWCLVEGQGIRGDLQHVPVILLSSALLGFVTHIICFMWDSPSWRISSPSLLGFPGKAGGEQPPVWSSDFPTARASGRDFQGGRAGVPSQPVWLRVPCGIQWVMLVQHGGVVCLEHPSPPALSRSLRSTAEFSVELQSFSCLAWHILCQGIDNPRRRLCPIPGQHLGCWARAIQEKLWWLCCPEGAGLPHICKTTTGLSSCKLVWLSPEKQSGAKDLSVPCGGFSRSQSSGQEKSLLSQHSLSLLPCSEQQKSWL